MISVDGVKTYSNAEALAALAAHASKVAKSKAIVEVGVFRGGSLKTLAQAAKCHVYGVDAWGLPDLYTGGNESPKKYGGENKAIAEQLLAGLDNVTLVHDYSVTAAANYTGPPIGLLYIDAEHTKQAVLADWQAWSPHLAPRAVIAFDDYNTSNHQDLTAGINQIVAEAQLTPIEVHGGRLAITRLPLKRHTPDLTDDPPF